MINSNNKKKVICFNKTIFHTNKLMKINNIYYAEKYNEGILIIYDINYNHIGLFESSIFKYVNEFRIERINKIFNH